MNLDIQEVDGDYVHFKTQQRIEKIECINCKRKPKYGDLIIFTKTSKNELLWWHRSPVHGKTGCTAIHL